MTFRLRTLLVGMTLVAVALYLLVVAPAELATPLLATIWVALAAFLTAGIVFGRGNGRAFCVGAMFPVGGTIFALGWLLFGWLAGSPNTRPFDRLIEEFVRIAFSLRIWSAMGWIMTLAAGAMAVVGRMAFSAKGIEARAISASPSDSDSEE